jgi:hypothetical protein
MNSLELIYQRIMALDLLIQFSVRAGRSGRGSAYAVGRIEWAAIQVARAFAARYGEVPIHRI